MGSGGLGPPSVAFLPYSELLRQARITATSSRPHKIGVGCPASGPFEVACGRLSGNGLQVVASCITLARMPSATHLERAFPPMEAAGGGPSA